MNRPFEDALGKPFLAGFEDETAPEEVIEEILSKTIHFLPSFRRHRDVQGQGHVDDAPPEEEEDGERENRAQSEREKKISQMSFIK